VTDEAAPAAARPYSGRTARTRNLQTPLRVFLRTETGGAAVLLGMAVAALAWVNIDAASYAAVWGARLSVRLAGAGVSLSLREWVNSGLMTFFFFVFGLEARREFDMGELRERARLALPVAAGLGGLLIPVGIYLAVNAGRPSADGWGAAMSTDTAFALGMLALTGPRFPDRVRAFLLSVAVVDDLASLVVIGAAYSKALVLVPLLAALGIFAVILVLRRLRIRYGIIYALAGIAAWVAVLKSGIDPVVVGLVMGLLTFAYPAARSARVTCSAASGSSPPETSPSQRGPDSPRRCRRTSGCSSSTTRGPAMSSCRCSRWPTPASASAGASWPAPTPRRSPSGS
jgi:Na+/H+ antiporter NhaA